MHGYQARQLLCCHFVHQVRLSTFEVEVLLTSFSTPAAVYSSVAPVYSSVAPVYSSAPAYSAPYVNASTPAYTPPATSVAGTGAHTAPIATFTGAANKAFAASGAGLAAVFGFAAYIL
jgi:hypothetical protein